MASKLDNIKAIHEIADRFEPKIHDAFLRVVSEIQDATKIAQL